MPATIYDVAKAAGVGIGTVSRVINDSPQISPKTREKVVNAIQELKYQPNVVAQGLARKRTNTIACIVPFFTGYFYFELLNGVQKAISKYGYDLILYSVDVIEKKETFFKKTLRERKVDGVLLVSLPIPDEYAYKFNHVNFPIVLLDSYHRDVDSISIENQEGAFIATEHLIGLGHRKIGMINGHYNSVPAINRLKGFKEALSKYNIQFEESFVVSSDYFNSEDIAYNHGFNKQAGYEAMNYLLNLERDRPGAVFVASDIQAMGAIAAIHERGLTIPNDIAIVGFDGIELSEYLGLTTMKQPMFEMGIIAVDRLMDKIHNGNDKQALFKKLFHPTLVTRETCGTKHA
jgi:LacI family transcriptional regulator